MRALVVILLATLTSACWTPGPGEVDPTRYPWDSRNAATPAAPPPQPPLVARGKIEPSSKWKVNPHSVPEGSSYCVMAIGQENHTGITISPNANLMACTAPPHAAPHEPK